MKKKSLNFIVPLVVYPFDVMVSVAQSDDEFMKSLRRHCPPDILKDLEQDPVILNLSNTTKARTINTEHGHQTIIRFKKWPDNYSGHGIISHEVFHAVEFVLYRLGLKHSLENGEAYAYLINYLTDEIYKRL